MKSFCDVEQKRIRLTGRAALGMVWSVTLAVPAVEALRVTSVLVTNQDVHITWSAPAGSNYVVQSAVLLYTGALSTNFADLGPPKYAANPQSFSFTHTNGLFDSTGRFYRVRSFPVSPVIEIQPTNVVIGVGMTNRYKVLLRYPDDATQDVTASSTLISSNGFAQVVGTNNGYLLVRGNSPGTNWLRAVYPNLTNSVKLVVSPLVGMYSVPPLSQINNYVSGHSTSNQIMGLFANGQTNNITPSCNLEGALGGAPVGTRVDYNVRPDVANSFALITGQSAASEDLVFRAGGTNTAGFHVNWCWFTGISLVPDNAQISLGATQQYTIVGHMANGTTTNALSVVSGSPVFTSTDPGIGQALSGLRILGQSNGRTTVNVTLNNGPGDWCIGGVAACTTLEVGTPTNVVGNVDKSFNFCVGTSGSVGYPYAIATQPDGRILIGGPFFYVNGISSYGIQRLLPDGNVDPSFRTQRVGNDTLNRIVVQPDGKILLATIYDPRVMRGFVITRLNVDGSLDEDFMPVLVDPFGSVNAMVLQPDGRILISGEFDSVNGVSRLRLARLHSNGSLDETFNPGAGPDGSVNAIALDSLSRIYIGGNFTNVNGIVRVRIARLTSTGSVDTSFEPSTGANATVRAIVVKEMDGYSLLVGGDFTMFRGLPSSRLAALDETGLLIPAPFAPPAAPSGIRAMALQPDGKTVVAGSVFWRLTTANNLDSTFSVPGGLDGVVLDMSIRTNATIDIAGVFGRVGGLSRRNVARLLQSAPP